MLRLLRQLTPEEMRQVAQYCDAARPLNAATSPEEVIRCLSRLCGVYTWGIFPATSEQALLDHAGRRLGMAPAASTPRALGMRERAIFASYFRQAWEAADPDRRRAILNLALAAWDNPMLPSPELVEDAEYGSVHPTLEALLQQSAGCRALAVATDTAPLPLPHSGPVGPPSFLLGGRGQLGHRALYGVLLVLWRARVRLLRERRIQRAQLERQLRQVETLMAVRRRNLHATPARWELNPASGLSLSAGAAAAAGIHLALAAASPEFLIPAAVVGSAGLAWSVSAILVPRPPSSIRLTRMVAQVQSFRSQLSQVEREIHELETE
jgi:hypothetical protein